jgi:hypothetical protein
MMTKVRVFVLLGMAAGCNSKTSNPIVPDGGGPDAWSVASDTKSASPDLWADSYSVGGPEPARDSAALADSGPAGSDTFVASNKDGAASPDVGGDAAKDSPAQSGGVGGNGGASGAGGAAGAGGSGGSSGAAGHVSVLEHHNHATRDGFFVDSALSKAAVAKLHVDSTFASATTKGPTYAQPLYLTGSGSSPDLIIVATEQNHVYAFDASKGGAAIWDKTLGTPLPKSRLATLRAGCGNIDPLGITGTPVIDPATRTIYLDAMLIASANATAQHQVFALDADTGATKSGWPVDLNATAVSGSTTFTSLAENQRGALTLLDGKVFVPFGGHIGDCGVYHGWVVGISTTDPTQVSSWASRAIAGGVWAPSGVSGDGKSLFFATGNTEAQSNTFSAPSSWQDGETIFRMPSSLTFSGQNADYFTPKNWVDLDNADTDLGGTGPIIFDVPGAKPSALVIGLGKDGNAYLLDRSNLGGLSDPLVLAPVATGTIINAAAVYPTASGTYVVFKGTGKGCPSGQSGGLAAAKISAGSPPTVTEAWCGGPATQESPAVSATDAQGTDAIVWIVGNDNKLYGLDGETGKAIFSGGASTDTMSSVQKFTTPIVANGRVFVAANNQVYAFTPN